MNHGIDNSNVKKKPWKNKVERDIIMHEDIKESGLHGGKIVGEKIGLFSLLIGIPLLIVGFYGFYLLFGADLNLYLANIILIFLVFIIGLLLTIGGYTIYSKK